MQLKSTWKSLGRILLWAIPLSLPLPLAGCGQTACFTWSKNEGACPAQDDALSFFRNPDCPSSILSVDSDGAFANNLCCYGVTKQDTAFRGGDIACFPPGGGGVGGFGGTGPTGVVTVGSGPPPPIPSEPEPSCFHCAQAIENTSSSQGGVCPESKKLLALVVDCVCNGPCVSVCAENFCQPFTDPSPECLSCIADPAAGCGVDFEQCANDI